MKLISPQVNKVLAILNLVFVIAFISYLVYDKINLPILLNRYIYDTGTWGRTFWLGVQMEQLPSDSQMMQELIFDIKPDAIIETGTFHGGSSLYYAGLIDQFKPTCKIITVDLFPQTELASKYPLWKKHVVSLKGSSVDPAIVDQIKKQIPDKGVVLVTLDSDHHRDHVYKELKIYSELVTPGSYLVVQDTNVNGHPVRLEFGPGPMEALDQFLKEDSRFESDRSKEKYILTAYPKGWLKRLQ